LEVQGKLPESTSVGSAL